MQFVADKWPADTMNRKFQRNPRAN